MYVLLDSFSGEKADLRTKTLSITHNHKFDHNGEPISDRIVLNGASIIYK